MDIHREELLKGFADAGLDFLLVAGNITLNYLLAIATLIQWAEWH
jgi:hypothetical protein